LFRRVFQRSLRLGATGTAIGLAIAVMATQLLEPLLFEVNPLDPTTFGVAAALLLVSAALAAVAPGTRAGRVEPAAVLRQD
jgi:predicted lysophospholipase L1 biosynthesis ABC-type transport system permease subunit